MRVTKAENFAIENEMAFVMSTQPSMESLLNDGSEVIILNESEEELSKLMSENDNKDIDNDKKSGNMFGAFN